MSKENQNRTKKVQQTAAVVTALKAASKDAKSTADVSNHSKKDSASLLQGQTESASHEERNDRLAERDGIFEKESLGSLNNDRSSLTYGLPKLEATDVRAYTHSSGTTGYWDKNDKAEVANIPYFGAWKNRVSVALLEDQEILQDLE